MAARITYLRMSITDRCNLRCFYCNGWQDWEKRPAAEVLRYEELLRVAAAAARLGVRKIRLTGGEPLVRRGVAEFVRRLRQTPGIEEVCLTTNGVFLKELAPELYKAGLRRLNVSLDTLRPERYRRITGHDHFSQVWQGLELALALGFQPVKVNCVVLKGVNDDELPNLALLARDRPIQVRFIELMPTGSWQEWQRHFLPMTEVHRRLAGLGRLREIASGDTDGPARIFRISGFAGSLGFISPMSSHQCGACNRLRLTALGRVRPCLLGDAEVDVREALRRNCSDAELEAILLEAMRRKNGRAEFSRETQAFSRRSMAAIGG